MSKLKNKVAVVTGGTTGIGFAIASQFITEGAKVVITGRNDQALDQAVKELGSAAVGIRADAANLKDTDNLVTQVNSLFGKVDILVVNAGVAQMERVGEITEAAFDTTIDINFKGAIFTTEKFIPILAQGASIIHISSVSAFAVSPGTAIYAASKAALNAYSRTAAIELAASNIRVNAINPALTETRMVNDNEALKEVEAFMKGKMPFKRYAQPQEVAKLAVFLASDDASFISGAEHTIDGAVSVNEPFRA